MISSCYAITASEWWKYGNLVIYIHIGVGSALLVSTIMGNARASKSETSNRYRFSRFSFYIKVHHRRIGRTYRQME